MNHSCHPAIKGGSRIKSIMYIDDFLSYTHPFKGYVQLPPFITRGSCFSNHTFDDDWLRSVEMVIAPTWRYPAIPSDF